MRLVAVIRRRMVDGPVLHENGLLGTSTAAAQKPLLDNIARANTTSYGSVLANYQDCLGLPVLAAQKGSLLRFRG